MSASTSPLLQQQGGASDFADPPRPPAGGPATTIAEADASKIWCGRSRRLHRGNIRNRMTESCRCEVGGRRNISLVVCPQPKPISTYPSGGIAGGGAFPRRRRFARRRYSGRSAPLIMASSTSQMLRDAFLSRFRILHEWSPSSFNDRFFQEVAGDVTLHLCPIGEYPYSGNTFSEK